MPLPKVSQKKTTAKKRLGRKRKEDKAVASNIRTQEKSTQAKKPSTSSKEGPAKNARKRLKHDPLAWINADEKNETTVFAPELGNDPLSDALELSMASEEDDGFGFFDGAPGLGNKDMSSDAPNEPRYVTGSNVLLLDDHLDFNNVVDWHERLREQLGGDVSFDASELTRIDGAGIQLLCAYWKSSTGQGEHPKWKHPSPELILAATTMGVGAFLGLDT